MAYSEELAIRVRAILADHPKVEEKKMMGGLTFMVNNKMCVGILQDDLIARINPADYERALEKRGCREMNFTGRPMKGFVFIDPDATKSKNDLNYWIDLALEYNKIAKVSRKRKK
jgi:TfoX/Sxy family transcriptional regulator of competence genes